MKQFRKTFMPIFGAALLLGFATFCQAELPSFADEIPKMYEKPFIYDSLSEGVGTFFCITYSKRGNAI